MKNILQKTVIAVLFCCAIHFIPVQAKNEIDMLLDDLDKTIAERSTLVIYMGDNGFAWGEHGLIDKRQFYEEPVRVPMLARCPELCKGGTVIEQTWRPS